MSSITREEFFKGVVAVQNPMSKTSLMEKLYMPFGKYKGKLVKDIVEFDPRYASWLAKQDFCTKFEDIYAVIKDVKYEKTEKTKPTKKKEE
jgi:uncharacterized protein (DUF3820 family)